MDITVQELKERLDKGDALVLIDVREPHENEAFNIGGELIPMGSLPTRISELEDKKEKEIVVYCRSGNRSGIAQQLLLRSGFHNVRNLEGGMLAWLESYPV